MLAPSFPEWLPSSVAHEAQRILSSGTADTALVLRLATDERMRSVWNELARHKPDHPCMSETWTTLMSDRVDVPPPPEADALPLFFWCAYTIASLGPSIGTISLQDLPIKKYQHVAAGLRWAAAEMRALKLKYPEIVRCGDQFSDIHAEQIKRAAEFCDENIAMLSKLKAAQAPLVVRRDHGNQEARGYVRMLAVETQNLFGRSGYRTLATVTSVALTEDVTSTQVRKWCDSFD
jgi:hypothetical protein